jgi:hypothetical protein
VTKSEKAAATNKKYRIKNSFLPPKRGGKELPDAIFTCNNSLSSLQSVPKLSASVVTVSSALLRAAESLGLPRVTPRAFGSCRDKRALLLGQPPPPRDRPPTA